MELFETRLLPPVYSYPELRNLPAKDRLIYDIESYCALFSPNHMISRRDRVVAFFSVICS